MSFDSVTRVARDSLSAKIADELRRMIISGSLSVDTRLVEKELAAQLGTSRAPLREALFMLEREGLVKKRPGRGTFVTGFTETNIRDTFAVRSVLDAFAAELAASSITAEQVAELESLLSGLERAANARDAHEYGQVDFAIHRAIWRASGNARLMMLLEELVTPIEIFMVINATQLVSWEELVSRHRRLVEAIASGDVGQAGSMTREHVNVSRGLQLAMAATAASRGRQA